MLAQSKSVTGVAIAVGYDSVSAWLKCFGRCLEPHHKDTFEAGVRSHSVEPWAQRRAFLDAAAIPPGTKQGLLHRVLGVRQGAEHAVTVDKQFAAMTLDIATELV
jgi:hypothetical protein